MGWNFPAEITDSGCNVIECHGKQKQCAIVGAHSVQTLKVIFSWMLELSKAFLRPTVRLRPLGIFFLPSFNTLQKNILIIKQYVHVGLTE